MTKLINTLMKSTKLSLGSHRLNNLLLVFLLLMLLNVPALSQSEPTEWLYLGTDAKSNRYYMSDDIQKYDDGFLKSWVKIITDVSSYSKRIYHWDCEGNRMKLLYMKVYLSNDELVYKAEGKTGWKVVASDSVGKTLLDYVCGVKKDVYWAEVTSRKANLRLYPGTDKKVLRVADKGTKLRIVHYLKDKAWYNVIDDDTQQDYWIHSSTIKVFKKN